MSGGNYCANPMNNAPPLKVNLKRMCVCKCECEDRDNKNVIKMY